MSGRVVELVRSGRGVRPAEWDGPDLLRPLSGLGVRQARGVADELALEAVGELWSSPALRCRQTLAPLAHRLGKPIHSDEVLGREDRTEEAVELLRGVRGPSIVCCTHGAMVQALAAGLAKTPGIEVRLHHRYDVPGRDRVRRLAVLDLGSTSFHLLVADVTPSGHLRPLDREKVELRLGAVIASDGSVPEEVVRRATQTARSLRGTAERLGVEELFPVGTSALREAVNGRELCARLAGALGCPIRLLAGETEARTVFGAFRRRVWLPDGPVLGADLGGGSLELVVGDRHGHEIRFETTLPLGAARLHRELVHSDPLAPRELRAIMERAYDAFAGIRSSIRSLRPRLAVATGGSARALGALALAFRTERNPPPLNGLTIPLDELRQLNEILVCASHDERLALPGIQRRRADLLPTASLILTTLAEVLDLDGFTLCDWGLREGILLEEVGALG